MRSSIVMVALLVLVASAAVAQPRTEATLRVTVVDPSGAVIVGAHVRVSPVDVEIETGARGDAAFTELAPGRYTIHVEAAGFAPAEAR
jgi:hypothetical protein